MSTLLHFISWQDSFAFNNSRRILTGIAWIIYLLVCCGDDRVQVNDLVVEHMTCVQNLSEGDGFQYGARETNRMTNSIRQLHMTASWLNASRLPN